MKLECTITDFDGMRKIFAKVKDREVNTSISQDMLVDLNDSFCSMDYSYNAKILIMTTVNKTLPEIEWLSDRLFCPYEEGRQINIIIDMTGTK
jgi:hypothetical protein